jgi:hypothetical protein
VGGVLPAGTAVSFAVSLVLVVIELALRQDFQTAKARDR